LRPDYGAAFSIEAGGEERLITLQEVERRTQDVNFEQVLGDIRQAIAEEHEIPAYAVVLVQPGTIEKTSSGKIQRRAARTKFLNGELGVIADWSENPKLTSKFRTLQGEVDALAQQLQVPKS